MQELFKDIINASTAPFSEEAKIQVKHATDPLKPRYVVSVILEFSRTLLENSIP